MSTTETMELTEGERIYLAARELLNTIPPDDRFAKHAGPLVGILDFTIKIEGESEHEKYRCDVCGAPADISGKWYTVPVPYPATVYVCELHRDRIEGCDRVTTGWQWVAAHTPEERAAAYEGREAKKGSRTH